MNYQTYAAPDTLKPYVRYFWVLENSDADDSSQKIFGAIADGCPGIILHQTEKGSYHDESNKQLPEIFLYGQTIDPVKFYSPGRFTTIGVWLYPHALKSVFGFDANEFTGSCLDLDLVRPVKGTHVSEQLINGGSIEQRIRILSSYLLAHIERNKQQPDEAMKFALTQIAYSKGNISLKALQETLRLSERTLERKFKQIIGISPKLFTRIYRFQVSLNQLRKNNYDKLSDIAYENDYADQSHFIRAFKEFTGLSPFEFKKNSNELVENFPILNK
jgi:AraC-like DNA-binding protein